MQGEKLLLSCSQTPPIQFDYFYVLFLLEAASSYFGVYVFIRHQR